jgi:glycosyltransferase involved in cell wall biosynthesis
MNPTISIVIPVYNNQSTIINLVELIDRELTNESYNIILVDDGSIDNSWDTISKLAENRNNKNKLYAIKLKENCGQENAKLAGLRHSTGSYIVFMDADLHHHPKFIYALLNQCQSNFDVCYASFENHQQGFTKRLGSWLYNLCSRWLLNKPKGIYLSSFCMLTANIKNKIQHYSSPFVNIDSFVLRHTQQVTQITVSKPNLPEKKTNYSFSKMFFLFLKLLPGFSIAPIKLLVYAVLVLFFCLSIVFFYAAHICFLGDFRGVVVFVFVCLSFLFLSLLGCLSFYIAKVYLAMQSAKQFEIETIIVNPK